MSGLGQWLENLNPLEAGMALAAVEVIGDHAAKVGSETVVYISYLGLAYVLPLVLRRNPLGLTNGYWNAITNLTGVGIGYYYGEKYTHQQTMGIVFLSVGFLMLGNATWT